MEAPDYGAEEDEESEADSMNSHNMARANELVNSEFCEAFANEENLPGEPSRLEQRHRMATRVMSRFLNQIRKSGRKMIDGMLLAERNAKKERANAQLQQVPFLEVEVKEETRYGEELEERKRSDIFLNLPQVNV